jgi:hypothetical protein
MSQDHIIRGVAPRTKKERSSFGRCEQVFILRYPLLQVLDRARLSRGTFHVDLASHRMDVCPRDGADLLNEDDEVLTRDFRVPAESAALKMGCYPIGDVCLA